MERLEYDFSPTIRQAIKEMGEDKAINASALAQAVIDRHKEYADGRVASLQLIETSIVKLPMEWLEDARALFDLSRIQLYTKSDTQPVFHGRLLIIGLSLLESELYKQLENAGVFTALVKELHETLPEILTQKGIAQYNKLSLIESANSYDSVSNWQDDPLHNPEEDLLGRRAFARYLAKRIAAVPAELKSGGAYSMHVYGPWGAGKTTVLNFLRKELEQEKLGQDNSRVGNEKEKKWLIVDYNAWRQQHIQPPWWSLLEHIFNATKNSLSICVRTNEYWWRLFTGRMPYILGIVVLTLILAFIVFPIIQSNSKDPSVQAFGANAESLSKVLALVTSIWGGIEAINRSLLFGAASAAKNYADLTHDPTNKIKKRFDNLIKKLWPKRVIVLIDDLDRCQSNYVIELLEGIQTLFRQAPVVFVIAADRRWLNACYEEAYDKLKPHIHEPGKPLGTLFMEKVFRFSTPMPGMSEKFKEAYWWHLLNLKSEPNDKNNKAAKEQVEKAKSEGEVLQLVKDSQKNSYLEQRALREEAALRLASPEILDRLEHTLKKYSNFLEPNPRGMKLLVNSYSANRALTLLSEIEIDFHQLALWTIFCSRWPQLADLLAEYPEMLEKLQKDNNALPENLKILYEDTSFIKIVKGDGETKPLSLQTLKNCAQMRS